MTTEKTIAFEEEREQRGYTVVPNSVLLNAGLSPTSRCLWAVLAHYARQAEECWPGIRRLGADMGLGETQLRQYVRELVDTELLGVTRRGLGLTNLYRLSTEARKTEDPNPRNTEDPNPRNTEPKEEAVEEVEDRLTSVLEAEPAELVVASKSDRDELWEALAGVVGWRPEPGDKQAAKRFGRAVNVLVDVRAAPSDVVVRGSRYRVRYPGLDCTPEALLKHWSSLQAETSNAAVTSRSSQAAMRLIEGGSG